MVVYQIMEYRSFDEHYSWGIYSSEENANLYLKTMGWDNNLDFEIIPYEVDGRLKGVNYEKNNKNK